LLLFCTPFKGREYSRVLLTRV